MCLYTTQLKPKVAKKDIYVFKVLRKARIHFYSPCRDSLYLLGHMKKSALGSPLLYYGNDYRILEGLYAYTRFNTALGLTYCHNNRYVFIAKIPKGSLYYKGYYDEIVANALIVLPRTHPESLKRLRIGPYGS